MKRMTFKEYYAEYYYRAEKGNWAGQEGELQFLVVQRIADAFAAYADYVADWLERK